MVSYLRAKLERLGFRSGIYPRQFWVLFWGMLISTIGMSMVWPFLIVYVSGRLQLPLTAAAGLFTISAIASFVSSVVAGPIIDKVGRKWMMVFSLVVNGLGYFFLARADAYVHFALLMGMNGFISPMYRIAADAMMADLVPATHRADGYSLLRMSNNIGISIGPALGGFVTSISYAIAFYFAAGGLALYGLIIAVLTRETLPEEARAPRQHRRESFGGYGRVFADRPFTGMVVAFTVAQLCTTLIWVLLAVYAKTNYGVMERQYGWIPTTNALMVVLFQFMVTQVTKKHAPLLMLALGAALYGLSNLSIAFSIGFWGFWASMVIMTVGELILVPTSSTYAANLAPPDMRARYMSVYGMSWIIAQGIGPLFGGLLNDTLNPQAIWFGGSLMGLLAVGAFLLLHRRFPMPASAPEPPPTALPALQTTHND